MGRHMDDFISSRQVRQRVQVVMEFLERAAQFKITVLDQFGNQARFLGSFVTKAQGGYTIQTDTDTLW